MKIAISKGAQADAKYGRYSKWIHAHTSDVECVDLDALDAAEALEALRESDALLLSGGPDVDPDLYRQGSRISECGATDRLRDGLEYSYLRHAIEQGMPILGICRGMQIVNVYFGGTLVVDIPTDVPGAIAHKNGLEDAIHLVNLTENSYLGVSTDSLVVNSFHHQAVDRIADGFVVTARAPDGVIEAMESGDLAAKIMCVQWHPERMQKDEYMSKVVINRFLSLIDDSVR